MKATLTSINHRDFSQRYGGTFGWLLKDDGNKKLVKVDHVNEDFVEFTDSSGLPFRAMADKGVHFEFIPVDKGWYLGKSNTLYFMYRIPARQWKRGIHPDNTRIASAAKVDYGQKIDLPLLEDIFVPGMDNWRKMPKPPMALNEFFAIDKDNNLWFYNKKIGKLVENVLKLNNELFYQEVLDAVRRKDYNFTVAIDV